LDRSQPFGKSAGVNRLGQAGTGTVVDFVQNFSLAGATGLDTLAAEAGYVARPGIELAYAGDIVLASNWNLGAGIVDEAGARAANLLFDSPVLGKDVNDNQLVYLAAGSEAEIFNNYTNFLYRVGGKASGAAGVLTRFGPFFDAEAMGGAFCLCAMAVPADRFGAVADIVNAHPEVAHNYERDHALNMWFVLATETLADIDRTAKTIESETGLDVLQFPKLEEFFIGFKVAA